MTYVFVGLVVGGMMSCIFVIFTSITTMENFGLICIIVNV